MSNAWGIGLITMLSLPLCSHAQERDTVLAVHHLFKQKRRSGAGWVSTGVNAAFDESIGWRAHGTTSDKVAATTVYGGIPLVVGVFQIYRFSVEWENVVIQLYKQGMPIPADIRQKLRNRHFRRTARDVMAAF